MQTLRVAESGMTGPLRGFASLRLAVVLHLMGGVLSAQTEPSPLVTWVDLLPARRGAALWARNPTADTVWIDSLHVEKCQNIRRSACGTRALELALPPGSSKELHRLEPAVPRDAFSYEWFLDWKTAKLDSTRPRPRKPKRDSTGVVRT
jgi:hypothetical protein